MGAFSISGNSRLPRRDRPALMPPAGGAFGRAVERGPGGAVRAGELRARRVRPADPEANPEGAPSRARLGELRALEAEAAQINEESKLTPFGRFPGSTCCKVFLFPLLALPMVLEDYVFRMRRAQLAVDLQRLREAAPDLERSSELLTPARRATE